MLTRLTDRIEALPDDEGEQVIKRYGMWGTTAEIEKRGRVWFVIYPDGNIDKFKTLTEAEGCLKELVNWRK